MRAGRSTALAIAVVTATILGTTPSAHRLDEYLQAARLAVEPRRVDLELDLTPGIALADAMIAEIDRDRDGVLSGSEKRRFAGRVLDAVVIELDGRQLHLEAIGSTFPGLDDFRHGEGTIRLQSVVVLPRQADGEHRLSLRNMDQRDGSVYLANALVPNSDRIAITAQRRDPAQRTLAIDYVLRPGPVTSVPGWLLGSLAGLAAAVALLMRPPKMG